MATLVQSVYDQMREECELRKAGPILFAVVFNTHTKEWAIKRGKLGDSVWLDDAEEGHQIVIDPAAELGRGSGVSSVRQDIEQAISDMVEALGGEE